MVFIYNISFANYLDVIYRNDFFLNRNPNNKFPRKRNPLSYTTLYKIIYQVGRPFDVMDTLNAYGKLIDPLSGICESV